jgi:hypothetical protein
MIRHLLSLSVVLLLVVACSRDPGDHIVVPRAVAAKYGVRSDKPIREVSRENTPIAVRRAAEADAQRTRSAAECTRYFPDGERYLVLLNVDCDPGKTFEDGQFLAAYTASGERIQGLSGPYGHLYSELVPFSRDRRGRAFE